MSCAGKVYSDSLSGRTASDKVVQIKQAGEACLRRTGLGYTIVRPAQLIEEPGGYKALLFDQVRNDTRVCRASIHTMHFWLVQSVVGGLIAMSFTDAGKP